MTKSPRPVSEDDLLAFVDGRLDPARQGEVEDHLLQDADDSLRVAADVAILEGLRLLFGRDPPRRPARRRAYSFLA